MSGLQYVVLESELEAKKRKSILETRQTIKFYSTAFIVTVTMPHHTVNYVTNDAKQ